MTKPDAGSVELQLFGLPSLVLAAVAAVGILYAVFRLVEVAWPMAQWMTFTPPG